MKLLRFLADRLDAAGPKLPPRHSLVNSDGYARLVGQDVALVARSFSDQVTIVPMQGSDVLLYVGAMLVEAIVEIVAEDLDPAQVLPEVQRRALRVFD